MVKSSILDYKVFYEYKVLWDWGINLRSTVSALFEQNAIYLIVCEIPRGINTYVQMYCIKLRKCVISGKPQIKNLLK